MSPGARDNLECPRVGTVHTWGHSSLRIYNESLPLGDCFMIHCNVKCQINMSPGARDNSECQRVGTNHTWGHSSLCIHNESLPLGDCVI